MSIEQGTIPTPSGDPFYDALIKRLHMDDDRTRYWDALYFRGSAAQIEEFSLYDYWIGALKEAPPIHKRNAETRRALLARGVGCLTVEMQVTGEEGKRSYFVTRPADHTKDTSTQLNQQYMREHYPALVGYDLNQPRVFRFMPTADETIIERPLEHPYLREVMRRLWGRSKDFTVKYG